MQKNIIIKNKDKEKITHRNTPKTIKELRADAEKIGLEYLGTKPVPNHTKALYRCNACQHKWWKEPGNVQQGHSCAKCYGNAPKTLEEMQIDADKVGLEYLETIPLRFNMKAHYKCKKCGYDWWKRPNTIQRGQGCAKCHNAAPKTLKDLQIEAEKVGLEYLELKSMTKNSLAHYKCKKCNHTCLKAPSNVQQGQGCPKCKINRYERTCHQFFEAIFNDRFKQDFRPNWLHLGKQRQLHLDGYCRELQLGFEYNGPQHYVTKCFNRSLKDFENQQARDAIKAKRCIEHDIILIIVPYWIKPSEMQDFIMTEYKRLTGKDIKCERVDWKSFDIHQNQITRVEKLWV